MKKYFITIEVRNKAKYNIHSDQLLEPASFLGAVTAGRMPDTYVAYYTGMHKDDGGLRVVDPAKVVSIMIHEDKTSTTKVSNT